MQLYIALADDRDPKLLGEALTLPASETADTDGYAYSTATLTTDLSAYSKGRNAIVGGFQGQRQWTDYRPNCDVMESILEQ